MTVEEYPTISKLPNDRVEEGCFVFQILRHERIRIRPLAELQDENEAARHRMMADEEYRRRRATLPCVFERNELIAADMILYSSTAAVPSTHDKFDQSKNRRKSNDSGIAEDDLSEISEASMESDATGDLTESIGSPAIFARLADQSGWITVEEKGELYLRKLPVDTSLYCFYVDNAPHGITVRRHPMDDDSEPLRSEFNARLHLLPMQKIYCDRKVTHPVTCVNFYRLQMSNSSYSGMWVCDKQKASGSTGHEIINLVDEKSIKTGLFAYLVLTDVVVRQSPDCSDTSKTNTMVETGDLIVSDVIRSSPLAEKSSGPYVHLSDGSGWLFEQKRNEAVLEPIPITKGNWIFRVLNEPVGIALRTQPIDSQEKIAKDISPFRPGELIQCDSKIESKTSRRGKDKIVNYFRVVLPHGKSGWIFDKRDDTEMLEMISEAVDSEENETDSQQDGWTPEFVRGIAAIVDHLKEISFQPNGSILKYETADSIGINIFCATRSVQTSFQHPVLTNTTIYKYNRNCTAKELHGLLSRDVVEMMIEGSKGEIGKEEDGEEKKEDNDAHVVLSPTTNRRFCFESIWPKAEKELDIRNELIECDNKISELKAKRQELWDAVKIFDDERAQAASQKNAAFEDNDFEMEKDVKLIEIAPTKESEIYSDGSPPEIEVPLIKFSAGVPVPRTSSRLPLSPGDKSSNSQMIAAKSLAAASSTNSARSSRRAQICGECHKMFAGKYSRDLHCREVHKLFCTVCDRIFPSFKELEAHRDRSDHW